MDWYKGDKNSDNNVKELIAVKMGAKVKACKILEQKNEVDKLREKGLNE